ncbi:MAG: hypothetical protein WD845_08800 [Pirellulales bacterium]
MDVLDRHPAATGRWWRIARRLAVLLCAPLAAGCGALAPPEVAFAPPPLPQNPITVAVMDRDFVWDQVVDVVDDYFRIQKEDRVKLVGDLLTEGRIDTYPRTGSTIFEPWNKDSVTPYQRWEATLQSLRRTAIVRVVPSPAGFDIDVQVYQELENLERPESGAVTYANSAALRNDNSLKRVENPIGGRPPTLGWIGQGRDGILEQQILSDIQARLAGYAAPQAF